VPGWPTVPAVSASWLALRRPVLLDEADDRLIVHTVPCPEGEALFVGLPENVPQCIGQEPIIAGEDGPAHGPVIDHSGNRRLGSGRVVAGEARIEVARVKARSLIDNRQAAKQVKLAEAVEDRLVVDGVIRPQAIHRPDRVMSSGDQPGVLLLVEDVSARAHSQCMAEPAAVVAERFTGRMLDGELSDCLPVVQPDGQRSQAVDVGDDVDPEFNDRWTLRS
jgi:hypothetical protein